MAINFDSASNSTYQAASGSYSWSHTVGTGQNRILVVSIALLNVANDVTTLTYNSISLTRLRSDVDGTGTIRTDIYYLLNPTSGTNTIAVTLNSASVSAAMATSYTGVDQYTPIDAQNGTTGTTGAGGGSASLATTVVTEGAWIVDAVATVDTAITVGAGQNQRSNVTGAVGSGGQSDKGPNAAGSITMQWDNVAALTSWTMSSFAMLPATTRGTTTSTSSTSASTFSTSSTSSSISSTSTSVSTTSISTSSTSSSTSTSSTSSSISSTSSSISSTSVSSTSQSTSISSTSSSISSTSQSSTSKSTTSQSTSISSTSSSFSSTSSSISSTSFSTSSTSFSSTSSSSSTSTTTVPSGLTYSYEDVTPLSNSQIFNTTSTWTAPTNVTSVLVSCWGGGGGSGGGGAVNAAAGGGGGAFSQSTIAVVPGTVYTVTVGTGGTGAGLSGNGGPGNDSWFGTTDSILAKGGGAGAGNGGGAGAGGAAGSGVGTIVFSGGNGAVGSGSNGGGGGGSAGSKGDGGAAGGAPALGLAGGGTPPGADGATGGGSGVNGGTGDYPGGGASGGGSNISNTSGAGGADGQIQLSWLTTSPRIDNAALLNSFSNANYSDVAGDDEDYFIEYGSEYMTRQYKRKNTNNTDNIIFTWKGRSTLAPTISPILIQLYCNTTAVASYSETNRDDSFTMTTGSKSGQSFIPSQAGPLSSTKFYLRASTPPVGTAVSKIYNSTGTAGNKVPTGTALATSNSFNLTVLTDPYALYEFVFTGADKIALDPAVEYVVTLEITSTDTTVFVGDDSSSPTASGNASFFSGTWQVDSTEDTIFYVNIAGWQTVAVNNTSPADTDFQVKVTQSTNLSSYYDSNNIVIFRSYQQVI